MTDDQKLRKLRILIEENLRIQKGTGDKVDYIDPKHTLDSVSSKQNHVVFGRRGCGKSLLLHYSSRNLPEDIRHVYLNCEDFKNHSFPNVLIEILDTLFEELQNHVSGWFGKKKECADALKQIREKLQGLRMTDDERTEQVKEVAGSETTAEAHIATGKAVSEFLDIGASESKKAHAAIEREYQRSDSKIQKLSLLIPELKKLINQVFSLSSKTKFVYLQLDDFYHLQRAVQPHVMDYIHRISKDVPIRFKIATLRHASTLYADRDGQPTGAQERHDYQPINVDFTLQDFKTTQSQLRDIFHLFGKLAGMSAEEVDALFKGEGFERLILAGGGVPRDCLSLFLAALDASKDGRIGKDDVRALSLTNLERRIEELKADSQQAEQEPLMRGIYVIRSFCAAKKNNGFLVSDQMLQQNDKIRHLLHRLLDYRIIHSVGSAVTHKSRTGTFQAFVIDIGCYANLRKLEGKFTEIDISHSEAKERLRTAPVLEEAELLALWKMAPTNVEAALKTEEVAELPSAA